MGKNVFANGMEISGKASDHMCIAAMPDVCMSPPSPPAGPLPVPYPDTSKSKDLKDGSKKVKIGSKPVCLDSKSHYKSSPLGDEASTKSFGSNVVDHTNAGKTHCQASSMDVAVEGEPVTRTGDLTTSNHMSAQPSGGAMTMQVGGISPPGGDGDGGEDPKCDCCGGPVHTEAQKSGKSMTASEWYNPPFKPRNNPPSKKDRRAMQAIADAQAAIALSKEAGCGNIHEDEDDPCAKHYVVDSSKKGRKEYADMISPMTPESEIIKMYGEDLGKRTIAFKKRLIANSKKKDFKLHGHKTPLAAGGCPIGEGNVQSVYGDDCKYVEDQLGDCQNRIMDIHNGKW
ncbi:MAG: PAAR-like domain-containing protein [Myxococcota bacterium]